MTDEIQQEVDRFRRFVRIPDFAWGMWQDDFSAMLLKDEETATGAAMRLWCLLGDEGRLDLAVWGHYAVSKGIIGKSAWSVILRESWQRGASGSLLSPFPTASRSTGARRASPSPRPASE